MWRIRFIPDQTSLPFMQWRKALFMLSITLIVASAVLLGIRSLDFGIDFSGGIVIEVETETAADLPQIRTILGDLDLGDVALQEFGDESHALIRIERQDGGGQEQQAAITRVKEALEAYPETITYRRTESVGPKVGDELIQAKISSGDQDILLATNNGKSIRFNEKQIRSTGRKTKGVTGIRMSFKDDFVIGMLVVKREGQVLVVSSKGFGKRSNLDEYREQKRGGKGVFTLKANQKTGKLISIMEVVNDDDLMIITDTGIMIRQSVEKLNVIGRNTQGVKLLRLDKNSSIASVTKVIKEDEENNESDNINNPTEETPETLNE